MELLPTVQGALPGVPLAEVADVAVALAAAEHRVARLRGGVLLLDARCSVPLGAADSTEFLVNGRAIPPPTCAIVLGSGEVRSLFFAARPATSPEVGSECELRRGNRWISRFRLVEPVPAPMLLLERSAADRERLLRFLLDTCAPLLRLGADPEFAALCLAVARAGNPLSGDRGARPLSRNDAPISLWEVDRRAAARDGTWHLVTRRGIRRVAAPVAGVLALEGPLPAGTAAVLVPPAPARPLALAEPPTGKAVLPTLLDLLRRARGEDAEPAQRRALAALAKRAAAEPRFAALLREVELLAPARPRKLDNPIHPVGGALELALADGAGGLFLSGWLRDPLDLVTGFELHSLFGKCPIPPGALHRVPRPDLVKRFAKAPHGGVGLMPGFVAHLPNVGVPATAVQWRLGLRLASGEAIELVAPPGLMRPAAARDLVLRAAPPEALSPRLLDTCIAPAAACLHRAALASGGTPEVITFGTPVRRPRCTVVVPLYRHLGFLRFQLGAFARDPELREAELILVLDSPEQRAEVEHLLRGLSALQGLPITLLVQPDNQGYASACNAGAAMARAPILLLLNSDVVPAGRGWLGRMLARFARDKRLGALGPKLLFDNGSIQHAGLLFRRGEDGQWLNDHYFKGFPRRYPPAEIARRVPGVTGAALCTRRAVFEAVGGFCTDYIIGDYEDSDLCLKLRSAGHEIAYESTAELFHFERQSIENHAGYARTAASAYNRRLHHRRWESVMAALMARFPEG